jgi:hypothetical protein
MKFEVMVSHLQTESGVYHRGEIIELEPVRAARIGNAVREVPEPNPVKPAEPIVIKPPKREYEPEPEPAEKPKGKKK